MIATTATLLGFDFVANPTITTLPDSPSSSSLASALPSLPFQASDGIPGLASTPLTPGLDLEAELYEDDNEWERISSCSEGEGERERGRDDAEDDMIVLGELELEDAVDEAELASVSIQSACYLGLKEGSGGKTKKGRSGQTGKEKRGMLSYAAMLGKPA